MFLISCATRISPICVRCVSLFGCIYPWPRCRRPSPTAWTMWYSETAGCLLVPLQRAPSQHCSLGGPGCVPGNIHTLPRLHTYRASGRTTDRDERRHRWMTSHVCARASSDKLRAQRCLSALRFPACHCDRRPRAHVLCATGPQMRRDLASFLTARIFVPPACLCRPVSRVVFVSVPPPATPPAANRLTST